LAIPVNLARILTRILIHMILSQQNLAQINCPTALLPTAALFNLPEKVLQFGTGVLLRGLPDFYIDKANRAGFFNGRVVVVKSTDTSGADDFERQDCLYTIYSKGIVNGQPVTEQVISSAISRVLSAAKQWDAILEVAKSPDLEIVISNTTEVGITLVNEAIGQGVPKSFPGKLLAVLYHRYQAFNGSADSGLVIIPTELLVDNGKKLKAIIMELARINNLEPAFINWLENSNHFCNSLVDRIVPGRPDSATAEEQDAQNGYTDKLAIMTEAYSLWAIEGDDRLKQVLSFAPADEGVVIAPDIELFRELKLRLLNGTHTLCCAYAFLLGFKTVKDALDDEAFNAFTTRLMLEEIKPAIPYQIDEAIAADFAAKVLDRFRNPYIRHEWLSISVQYATKIKMRVVPLLINYYKIYKKVPAEMALGLAAFIRFMQIKADANGQFVGLINQQEYKVTDSQAGYFAKAWETDDSASVIKAILQNTAIWDADLDALPVFTVAVTYHFTRLTNV
jgi:tagaturonate reductase